MSVDLLVCVATDGEGALLRARLEGRTGVRITSTGVGAVNAAHAVTGELVQRRPRAIVVCGVGGAYPGSGLGIGDVACASREMYGDLGSSSPNGFLDMEAIGLPIVDWPARLYNTVPMQIFPAERRVTFVTVNTCTGTAEAAAALESRTGGAVENMEGAAIAHIAFLHGIPVGEIRGISNIVTDRDRSQWRVPEAAAAAQEALLAWMAEGGT